MKRLTIIALIVLLIAGVFVSCNEENIVDDEFIPPIDITSETTTLIPGSRYRTVEDTTIADRITIDGEGSVTIILTEGTTLTAEKGINVTDDQEILIKGTGKLVATGDPKSAGIGGGDGEDGGTVRIQGGDITANGGNEGGAGIGGGKGGKSGTTIIEKKEGKAAPDVKTKGGKATSHGIGNGDGVTEDPEEVKLNGMDLEVSNDGEFWEDYGGDNPEQYMRSYVAVVITYNANGGTGSMPAQKVHSGVATTLNANAFTKEGKVFKGWNTKADGTGTAYANGASVTLTEDVTLYARWEAAPEGYYITSDTETIQSGHTWTIQENVENEHKIIIEGNEETTILLPEGLKLEVKYGIAVSSGQTLVIDGTGELVAGEGLQGGYQGQAGIGGREQFDHGGTIIIENGTVTAYGGWDTSGIGCKNYPEEAVPPAEGTANIQIRGGVVTSIGDGAGIGGYKATILIEGGEVHATADDGAGIGGYGCSITINGGEIYATGGEEGAGIGSNNDMFGPDPHQDITITGGTITAIGGSCDWGGGAGIGGGNDGASGTITITGGSITATGGYSVDESAAADGIGRGLGSGARDITVSGVTLFVSEDGIGWSPYAGTPRQYMKTDNVQLNYITTSTASLEAGKTYTIAGDVTNNNRITISGAVTISLPAGRTLTLSKGITVAEGQTLTISGDSSGKLYATGLGDNAGIGGLGSDTCGTIIIDGGEIHATGGNTGGAGIGSGTGATNGGAVIINGGTVIAVGQGGSSGGGAGIGGGQAAKTAPVSITINGGNVTATGATSAAGIGGGANGPGNVTINGGTITAIGGGIGDTAGFKSCGGSGIGCGRAGDFATVNITGGDITANGNGGGAGIGGAENYGSVHTTISITISGGRVTATGSSGTINAKAYAAAGIGGTYNQPDSSSGVGSMTITLSGSAEIKASAADATGGADKNKAWGIGRGNASSDSPVEANLNISGLDGGNTLMSSDYSDYDYDDYSDVGCKQYMKTANYVEPEP
jgi:uncharacterized repeat protein (TIGR02543 family)